MREKVKFMGALVIWEALLIISIALACSFTIAFPLFYNGLYGMVLSIICPLLWYCHQQKGVEAMGIKPLRKRDWFVLFGFVIFSIGGQLLGLKGERLDFQLLALGAIPLIMTTFFEEFLFRGFMQAQLEKRFGAIPAVVGSGLAFSLYHLGYPGFRTLPDTALLIAVGLMFALAFNLAGNNLIVSYFVNLPNALLTYSLKYIQFPIIRLSNVIYAVISCLFIIAIFWLSNKKRQKKSS